MQLDASKEKICINQLIGQKDDIIEVEGDVIVNDIKPDVLNVISTSGNVCIYKKEVLDGKIRLDGAVIVDVIYLADDETSSLRSLNTFIDFSQIIGFDNCKNGMNVDDALSIKNLECKVINSRKINVRAFLDSNLKIYSNENVDIINDINSIEDIQCLSNTLKVNSLVGSGFSNALAKDTIGLDSGENIAEILKSSLTIKNKDIKISYNKILAKADVEFRIMYLTEDNNIKTATSTIPIMGFIDMPQVNDGNRCNTKYKLKNLVIKPNNIDEHSINVEAEFEISCYAYENKQINAIQDLYSPTSNIEFTRKQMNVLVGEESLQETYSMQESISIPEIENNKIYDVFVKPNVQKTENKNGELIYEGEVELEFLYETGNSSKINSKMMKIPFNFSMSCENIEANNSIDTIVTVKKQDFVILNDGNIQANIDLDFNVLIAKSEKVNVIDNIDIKEKQECSKYSMVIYFVKPKDTLWEIAKKFDSTIEEIVKVNDIEDANKIFPGMQLFIPKYCAKKTA